MVFYPAAVPKESLHAPIGIIAFNWPSILKYQYYEGN